MPPKHLYRRVDPDEMEEIRGFIWAGRRSRDLMQCAPVFRVADGERFATGATWGHMQLGIDFGRMMECLTASASYQRIHRLMAWADGETFKSFGTIERTQLEDDALKLKELAMQAYARMFPFD